jgi:hypothetical protein
MALAHESVGETDFPSNLLGAIREAIGSCNFHNSPVCEVEDVGFGLGLPLALPFDLLGLKRLLRLLFRLVSLGGEMGAKAVDDTLLMCILSRQPHPVFVETNSPRKPLLVVVLKAFFRELPRGDENPKWEFDCGAAQRVACPGEHGRGAEISNDRIELAGARIVGLLHHMSQLVGDQSPSRVRPRPKLARS